MSYTNKADQAEASRRHYLANREKMIARAAKHRQAARETRRAELQQRKESTPCVDCGVSYPYYVMHFDHLEGTEKLFDMGRSAGWVARRRMEEEIAKCEIVCANCHAERTNMRRGGGGQI